MTGYAEKLECGSYGFGESLREISLEDIKDWIESNRIDPVGTPFEKMFEEA